MSILARVSSFPDTRNPSPDVDAPTSPTLLLPDDARLRVSSYHTITEQSPTRLRFVRPITDANNYQHCSPGSRVGFRCNATSVTIKVFYNNLVTRDDVQNMIAVVLVNGAVNSTFTNPAGTGSTAVVNHVVTFGSAVQRNIEVIWPYGDGMDLTSITVNAGVTFETAPSVPAAKLIMAGDSIVHGFTATKITDTFAFKLAVSKNRQLLNVANGSATIIAANATTALTGTGADRVVLMIGYNNFAAQSALAAFQTAIEGWINNAEAALPSAKIYIASMLYTPNTNTITPAQYRTSTQAAVTAAGGANVTYWNGLALMTNDNSRLVDGVHPNDTGASEVSTNMNSLMAA